MAKRNKKSTRAMRLRKTVATLVEGGKSKYAKKVVSGNQMYGWHSPCSALKNMPGYRKPA